MASLPTPPGSRDPTPQDKDKTPPPAFETDTPANSEEINTSKSLAPPSTTPDRSAPSAGNDKSTPSAESRENGEDGDEGSTGGSAELKRKSPHAEEHAAANNRRGRWADVTDEEVKYILTKLNLPTDGRKEDKVKRLEAEKWTQADIVEWKKNGGKQGKTLKHGTFDEIHQKVKERALGGGGVVIPADTSVPAQQPAYNEGGLSHDTSGPTDPHSIDTGKSTQIQAGQDESRTRNQATDTTGGTTPEATSEATGGIAPTDPNSNGQADTTTKAASSKLATGTSIDSDNSTSPKHLEKSGTSSGTTTATAGKAVTSKASALGSTNTPTTSSNTVSTTGSSPANNGEPETLARLPETYHDLLRHGELVTLLPRLASLQQDMPQSLKNAFESFRTSAPSSCVLFWIWLENEFSTADNKDAALGILEQLGNFDSLLSTIENWDWALKNRGPKAAHELQKTAEQVQAFWNIAHPGVRQSLGEYLPKQLGEALLRRLLGCQQKNSLIVEDPEEPGRFVDGQIVGRNTKKSSWFGVILPSRNKPGYWRGYWLQGKRYHEAYKAYVKAATFTLSIAGDPEFLDECEPEDFEIVAVFQMKWGQTYHTHALGVPNFSPTQPPMLFSKSILASPWGKKRAETVIDGYLRNAGQTNYLAAACSGVDRVSTKAW